MSHIVVLGAGVVGLSTAIRLLEKGYKVTIVAECFPGDKKTIEYTSPWAGAHHVSRADGDEKQLAFDKRTFEVMWEMSEPGHAAAGCFMRLHQVEHFVGQPKAAYASFDFMPGHMLIQDQAKSRVTVEFETVNIDTSTYLPYLLASFLGKGGRTVRGRVWHVSQVAQGAFTAKPDAIVVCAGLGARILGGVEDRDVYPVRGQVVLIRAPWIKFGVSEKTPNHFSYIIPRPSGDVIIGGTFQVNDWYPHARQESIDDIIKRTLELSTLIAPAEARVNGRTPNVNDVRSIMIESGCGFRPARKGGVRLEIGSVEYQTGSQSAKTPLIFNYGHGGQGYQSSWGTAEKAAELVEEALSRT